MRFACFYLGTGYSTKLTKCPIFAVMSYQFYLLTALGGALGSVVRGAMGKLIPFQTGQFAYATFSVNMFGCFLIGFLWMKIDSDQIKALAITGFLGGLTTFSGLGLELMRYFNEKQITLGVLYGLISLILGIFLVWLGQKSAQLV
jgi:fluoride exporter